MACILAEKSLSETQNFALYRKHTRPFKNTQLIRSKNKLAIKRAIKACRDPIKDNYQNSTVNGLSAPNHFAGL